MITHHKKRKMKRQMESESSQTATASVCSRRTRGTVAGTKLIKKHSIINARRQITLSSVTPHHLRRRSDAGKQIDQQRVGRAARVCFRLRSQRTSSNRQQAAEKGLTRRALEGRSPQRSAHDSPAPGWRPPGRAASPSGAPSSGYSSSTRSSSSSPAPSTTAAPTCSYLPPTSMSCSLRCLVKFGSSFLKGRSPSPKCGRPTCVLP